MDDIPKITPVSPSVSSGGDTEIPAIMPKSSAGTARQPAQKDTSVPQSPPLVTNEKSPFVSQPMVAAEDQPEETEPEVTESGTSRHVVPIIISLALLAIVGGVFAVIAKYITWNEDGEASPKEAVAFIPLTPPLKLTNSITYASASAVAGTSSVKGKLTVTLTKEKSQPFEGGSIRLYTPSGKLIKELIADKSGTASFEEVAPGTYKLEGGKKGEKRAASQTVTVGDGEIKETALSIFLDTNVTVTVTVKDGSGSPLANQAFTLRKLRSSEPPLDFPVATNENGTFTKSGISPDDNWKLLIAGEEVGTFAVAPTGKNQTINVTAKRN